MPPSPIAIAEVRGTPPMTSSHPILTPSPLPHILCDVCCEHVPSYLLRGCAACSHRYCAPCVEKYWTGAIYSGNHARLLCMYGGCGVFATDTDIAAVVSERTFRKMLYFRSRDRYTSCPDAKWCARDLCWELLGRFTAATMHDPVVTCTRCKGKTCVKCERLVEGEKHTCPPRRPNKAHNALFSLWATIHTKSCPACAARIQRNHGCSHMTCTRCSSYFCWRCKGFLNNGCPLPGRACICDRVMTAAAYSGLAVATVIGSPVIVAAAVIGGGPYVAYRLVRARKERARMRRVDRVMGDGVRMSEVEGREGVEVQLQVDRTMLVISQEESDLFGSSGGVSVSASEASEGAREGCRSTPFVLERRRGSVGRQGLVRRASFPVGMGV